MSSPASREEPTAGYGGEFVSISERLVVSPRYGRFHGEPIEGGRTLPMGSVLGRVTQAGEQALITSPLRAVFMGWLVFEGERVWPGRPLVLLRPTKQ
jgi:hypothetical protein